MPIYQKFECFVENLAEGAHNLGSDTLKVALSNTLPVVTNTVLSNISEISYTNLSTRAITTSTSAQTSGTYKLVLTDLVLTATGAVGPFTYVIIYNDTSASDKLIAFVTLDSAVTLANNDTYTIDFSSQNGVLQLA